MTQDMASCMRYYNQKWFHSSTGDMLPVHFESAQIKVFCLDGPEHSIKPNKITIINAIRYDRTQGEIGPQKWAIYV
jgi:hypothetical protein